MAQVTEILAEREATHGDFRVFADFCQDLKALLHYHAGWDDLTAVQREALEMVMHKIARVMCGNPSHQDHWDDIAGYSTLVSKDLEKQ